MVMSFMVVTGRLEGFLDILRNAKPNELTVPPGGTSDIGNNSTGDNSA